MDVDWKSIVSTVAPGIATALGGPMAGMAVKVLSNAVLGKDAGTQEEVAAAMAGASPETLKAIKIAELQFMKDMKELDVDLAKISADDRGNARARQVALKDHAPGILAVSVIAGFFGILAAMIFINIPDAAMQPLSIMLGTLGTLVAAVGHYYFGSSSGSSRKNDMIHGLLGRK
jgi:hypothetical protein